MGNSLQQAARLIKAGIGTRCIFVNVTGGFDTHSNQLQNNATDYRPLGQALAAFATDLGGRLDDVVLVVTTEFGRTAAVNGAAGTDHGTGYCAIVLGGRVRGGRVLGRWPGLRGAQLYENRDLAATTDWRDLFQELARAQFGIGDSLFPGYSPGTGPGVVWEEEPLRRSLLVAVAALTLSSIAASARCGEPIGTAAFGGYSFAKLADVDRHGGTVALDFDLAGPIAAFVDGSLHHGSDGALAQDDLTLMAGPGVRFGRRGGIVLFARGLAGLVHDAASVDVLDVSISEKSSRFGFMAGGGVDVPLGGNWALRAQGDYLWRDDPDGSSSGFRLAAGAVYRFGAKR